MEIDWFPFWLSLRVAAISTTIAVALGVGIAYLLANKEFRGREALDAAVTLPLVLPPTVLGYYLLVVLGRNGPLGRPYESVTGRAAGLHLEGGGGGSADGAAGVSRWAAGGDAGGGVPAAWR